MKEMQSLCLNVEALDAAGNVISLDGVDDDSRAAALTSWALTWVAALTLT